MDLNTLTKFLIVGLTLLVTPSIGTAASHVLSTQEALTFLSSYLTNPTQNWPQLPQRAAIPSTLEGKKIRRGIEILEHTSRAVGPNSPDISRRSAANNLNCISCHPAGPSGLPGTYPGQLPYVNVINTYPKLDPKTMTIITLQERIRGMFGGGNGKLTDNSDDMTAIIAYFKWLGQSTTPGAAMRGQGLKSIPATQKPDPNRGKEGYTTHCMGCHGTDGKGIQNPDFAAGGGYQFPPIAGDDSYNDSGHMAQISLFARFIYGYMPQGATFKHTIITPQNAIDIAAYVNTVLPRQHDPKRDTYYPNPKFR